VRSSLALIATVGLVAALTGCAAGSAPEATTGASTEAVTVTGEFGSTPAVSFPTPITPTETQCEVLIDGEGPTVADGQMVEAAYALYDGETGEKVTAAGFDEAGGSTIVRGATNVAIDKGLSCASEGSRVLVVGTDYDVNSTAPEEGADPKGGLVAVLDVLRVFPAKADGVPQLTRDGFPAVVLAPNGRPGITVPKSDPPLGAKKSTQVETLKAGNGPVVEDGDTVVVHFTAVDWDGNEVISELSTWEQGAPATIPATTDAAAATQTGLPIGLTSSLVGQKVGSQLGIIVPASEAYGEQGVQGKIDGGATLFFVVDVLGVV
jgi:FKBP-type peptidyl-prolyl cis-trans isomerase